MEADPLVLALDIGTSSARAIVFDSAGRAIPGVRAQEAYSLTVEPPGAALLDADSVVASVTRCVDSVLQTLGKRSGAIRAVGCCTFWHSMVGIDRSGKATTPLYTWADSRSAAVARLMGDELDVAAIHRRTGCAIHPSYFPARLRWLRETDPDLIRRTHRWISPGDFLYVKLFGETRCSLSMASATGLFDQNRCAWDPELLQILEIGEGNLCEPAASGYRNIGLLPEWAERWPQLAQIPWIPAIGDGAAGNLGSGCVTEKSVAINLGTSGAIRILWKADSVEIPPELWCYRLDEEHFVMGAAFSDGGEVYSWVRRTFDLGGTDHDIDSALCAREPDSHGLTFLPFLAGERSIGWRPSAHATLHGLSLSTEPMEVLQACMESVALRFLLIWRILKRYFPNVQEIVASGGAIAESQYWRRILASALGSPIVLSAESEASSRGAGIFALHSCGIVKHFSELENPKAAFIEPDENAHTIYQAALDRQEDLYRRLMPVDRNAL